MIYKSSSSGTRSGSALERGNNGGRRAVTPRTFTQGRRPLHGERLLLERLLSLRHCTWRNAVFVN